MLCLYFSFFLAAFISVLISEKKIRNLRIKSILIFLGILIIGYLMHNKNKSYSEINIKSEYFTGKVFNTEIAPSGKTKIHLQNNFLLDSLKWVKLSGKVLIYSTDSTILPGDRIVYTAQVSNLKKKPAPGCFNFNSYLTKKQYVAQGNIIDYEKANDDHFSFLTISAKLQKKLAEKFSDNYLSKDSQGILKAIILGYKNELDDEIQTTFSTSGIIHILAVSGLHTGLIYMGLLSLFSLFPGVKVKRYSNFIIIILLYAYAFITGLSPSVLRAATMFSIIASGKIINRRVNIFNCISLSAFLLLLFNTYLILDAGFQLSYAAVISILALMPVFQNYYSNASVFLKKLFDLISVSFSAQIGTLPFTLYYFKFIPVLSIFSNLIIVPLIPFLIIMGFAYLIIPFDFAHKLLSIPINYLIIVINSIASFISNLSFSKISFESFWVYQSVLLSLIIIYLGLFIYKRNIRSLNIFLFLIIILSVLNHIQGRINKNKSYIIAYDSGKPNLCLAGNKIYYFSERFNKYDSLNIKGLNSFMGKQKEATFINTDSSFTTDKMICISYGPYFICNINNIGFTINKAEKTLKLNNESTKLCFSKEAAGAYTYNLKDKGTFLMALKCRLE
jgi:competence protein ComEC